MIFNPAYYLALTFYKPNKKIGFKVNEPNGPNEPDIIQLIKINPKITQIELANQLNLSRSTIKRILNRLQQQEIVIRKGSNRNGYWAVKEWVSKFSRGLEFRGQSGGQ